MASNNWRKVNTNPRWTTRRVKLLENSDVGGVLPLDKAGKEVRAVIRVAYNGRGFEGKLSRAIHRVGGEAGNLAAVLEPLMDEARQVMITGMRFA